MSIEQEFNIAKELAFPQNGSCDQVGNVYDSSYFGGRGLTKREQFASMAMQGILTVIQSDKSEQLIAQHAVRLADALISELAKSQ